MERFRHLPKTLRSPSLDARPLFLVSSLHHASTSGRGGVNGEYWAMWSGLWGQEDFWTGGSSVGSLNLWVGVFRVGLEK
jgi:hypothetical protein